MEPSTTTPANPWASRQRWFVLGLLALFIALSVQYTVKVLDPRGTRSAIVRWREQLQRLDDGEDIYQRFVYPNPPIMALLLKPLAEMPPLAGALLWYYLKVGMTLAVFYWLFRLVPGAGAEFPPWAKAVVVLLSIRPIMGDLGHGNVNLFILFLVMAGLYAIGKGRSFAGSLLIALAVACKVTPALFLPYFVWKRAWRTLAGCAAGLVLFFWLVPSAFLGWDQNKQLLGSWTERMVKPFLVGGEVTSTHNNQSLPGLVFRLTTHSPSFIYFDGEDKSVPSALLYHNLVDVGPSAAKWIVKGCMVVFALLVVWTCRTPLTPTPLPSGERGWGEGRHGGWRLAAEFALVVLGMLLFSERTWKHHCVTLVLPFGVLCYYLATCRPGVWLRGYLIGSLAATALLMATTSTSLFDFLGDDAAKMAQVYGAYVWAYLILVTALVVVLRCREETTAEPVAVASLEGLREPLAALEVVHQRVSYCADPVAERLNSSAPPPYPNRLPR